MYNPSHFEESRMDVLHGLVRAHPLATLVAMSSDGLLANHTPLLEALEARRDPDALAMAQLVQERGTR